MSSYVNLLSEDEIQYHSAAADSRTIKLAMYGVGALIALIAAASFVSYKSTTTKAEKLRKRWAHNEPTYEVAVKNIAELKKSEEMVKEIKGWPEARLDVPALLTNIQDTVPNQMQIKRLTLLGNIGGIESGRQHHRGGRPANLTVPERNFQLRIEGVVVDDFGERIILDFVTILQTNPAFMEIFEKVDFKEALPTVIQHFETRENLNAHNFSIECTLKPRKIQWTGKA